VEERAAVDPKNIDEEPDVSVLADDGRWYFYGLVVGYPFVLLLCSFSLYSGYIWAINVESSGCVVRRDGTVSDESCGQKLVEFCL
jgi:hypothetical protein